MRRSYPDMERPQQGVAEFPKAATPAEEASPAPKIKIRIRFDYRGLPRPPRFFFGGKGAKEVAEEIRQQQANMWRHVPIQGVQIEDLEFFELYSVYDEIEETLAVYAPVELRAVSYTHLDVYKRQGRRGALAIDKYLKDDPSRVEMYDPKPELIEGEPQLEEEATWEPQFRPEIPRLPFGERINSFKETELGLDAVSYTHLYFLQMNKIDADMMKLQPGDRVKIVSPVGELPAVVEHSESLPRGLVSLPRSRSDYPVALLFSSPPETSASSSCLLYTSRCV